MNNSGQNISEKMSPTNGTPKNVKHSAENIKATSPKAKTEHFDFSEISLEEDNFATYYDENHNPHTVKRFTWKNKNKIEVQVVNFGAKVISIKLPDRKGEIEDVLLGFDDLAGYLFYEKFYIGSMIGRVSNIIKNGTFWIDKQKFTIACNFGEHHIYGGSKGFGNMVWDAYITDGKVIMSHISPHLTEGYPGDLLVRVTFELSAKNEFKVSFDAQTTRPTYVDFSHLLYFNLAGHHTGPNEVYRHILNLNCNCFTPQINAIPTGEIMNVMHTSLDFQVPKILGKVIGIEPKDGFDQNLCVNRGMHQDLCFVGRLLHPPSGRMLEVYSNQLGVNLKTANEFGYGNILSMDDIKLQKHLSVQHTALTNVDIVNAKQIEKKMLLYQKVHANVVNLLDLDKQQNFDEIMQLILKLVSLQSNNNSSNIKTISEEVFKVTLVQYEYLNKAREIVCENQETDDDCLDLKEVLSIIIKQVEVEKPSATLLSEPASTETDLRSKANDSVAKSLQSSKATSLEFSEKIKTENVEATKPASTKESKQKTNGNIIPVYYKNVDQIRGKGMALYQRHGAIALQTQNYPNAVNIKHFPNVLLNPGEVYRHEIVYRFWIRAGNPNKWIKRNLNESKQRANNKTGIK